MVDDETAGLTQALGSAVVAVAVAGENQQVGVFSGNDHLPFDVTGALEPGAGAAQPLGCRWVQA